MILVNRCHLLLLSQPCLLSQGLPLSTAAHTLAFPFSLLLQPRHRKTRIGQGISRTQVVSLRVLTRMILKAFCISNIVWSSSILIPSCSQALGGGQLSANVYYSIFRVLSSRGSQTFFIHSTLNVLGKCFHSPTGQRKYLTVLFIK